MGSRSLKQYKFVAIVSHGQVRLTDKLGGDWISRDQCCHCLYYCHLLKYRPTLDFLCCWLITEMAE